MKDWLTLMQRRFERWFSRHSSSVAMTLLVSSVTALIVENPFEAAPYQYKVGDIARRDIRAPQDLKALDQDATQKRRSAAGDSIFDLYDYDSERIAQIWASWQHWLATATINDGQSKWKELFSLDLSDQEWRSLQNSAIRTRLRTLIQSIEAPWAEVLVMDPVVYPRTPAADIQVRDIHTSKLMERKWPQLQTRILSVEAARTRLKREIIGHSVWYSKMSTGQKKIISEVVARTLDVNFVFNEVETSVLRDQAASKIDPIWIEVAEGEMIVREGQRVDRRHDQLLRKLNELRSERSNWMSSTLFGLLMVVLILTFAWIGRRNFRKFHLTFRDQAVLSGFFVISLSIVSWMHYIFAAAKSEFSAGSYFQLLIPLAFPGMTLRLFTSMEITTFFIILNSLAVGWLMKSPFWGLTFLVVCLAGAARMRRISQRLDVFTAGLIAGGIYALLILIGHGLNLVSFGDVYSSFWKTSIVVTILCLASGLGSGMFVFAFQPVLEYLGYTTDLRLMELSNTNHPLLRELILKAPGTYFHSFTVSQLSEKAAEAIHANPLFARVASLYHDIGKTKKPHYFIENIKGENRHDKMAPTMSALVIGNHVRDGIELAQHFRLPQSIVEIIPQHHGTALISYFYEKARQQANDEHEVRDQDFRYPGPKPQTREAAIIMLADAVEATAKSMLNATSNQLSQMVHKTIQRFFLDGQLDECDLSLKDLTSIGNAFHQILMGVYHHRIDYPHLKDASLEADTSTGREKTITSG